MQAGQDEIRFDPQKFEELILWIADKAPDIGLTKLEKLLYLCDFISAEKTGAPITGEVYRHFDRGPVPKDIKRILSAMHGAKLDQQEKPLGKNGKFIKLKPLRKCDQSKFTSAQRKTVEEVLEKFGRWSSAELVDYVHEDVTYLATARNEDIPYNLAIYRRYEKPDRQLAEEIKDDPGYMERLREALL
jgi:uncharacterized phage-associated protein